MSLRIVRLGTPRAANEGLRLGTVRRPPRGVRREDLARDDWYDVWLPQLSPSAELLKEAQDASSEKEWQRFARKYEAEMKEPDNARLIALLAALSKSTNLAAGCYCADETRCHRSLLRKLLEQAGAAME
ncbi:MAG TPA: DUF488 family protein [Thermoanaerobaculia bacterium]|nr:DUF488 family protein [Thermoanaerobaculia bacterium]